MKNRMLLCFVLCILILGGTAITHLSRRTFTAGDPPVTNPYKGFVCLGENLSDDPAIRFAYVPVYWSMAEPQEGEYAFEVIEHKYHCQLPGNSLPGS